MNSNGGGDSISARCIYQGGKGDNLRGREIVQNSVVGSYYRPSVIICCAACAKAPTATCGSLIAYLYIPFKVPHTLRKRVPFPLNRTSSRYSNKTCTCCVPLRIIPYPIPYSAVLLLRLAMGSLLLMVVSPCPCFVHRRPSTHSLQDVSDFHAVAIRHRSGHDLLHLRSISNGQAFAGT